MKQKVKSGFSTNSKCQQYSFTAQNLQYWVPQNTPGELCAESQNVRTPRAWTVCWSSFVQHKCAWLRCY